MGKEVKLYQLKVTLKGSKPRIWRRFTIVSDVSLRDLHHTIQVVMGWEDSHLHEFRVGNMSFGEPFPDSDMDDDSKVALVSVLYLAKQKLVYNYDFGDGWQHDIVLEKTLPYEPGAPLVQCLAGERACPPEDCGGLWGFYHFVEAISDPKHPDHSEMTDWYEGYQPEAFDLDAINHVLKKMTEPVPVRKRKKPSKPKGGA